MVMQQKMPQNTFILSTIFGGGGKINADLM